MILVRELEELKEKGSLKKTGATVIKQYENFVKKDESKEEFSKMIKILSESTGRPVVQHCHGGKDRTGYGAMLVLGLLGVKEEDLLHDHTLMPEQRRVRNEKVMEDYRKLTDDKVILDNLYAYIEAKPEFIKTSMRLIIDEYGSIKNYAIKELGIEENRIKN